MSAESVHSEREIALRCFRLMTRIRRFEEKVEALRPLAKIPGAAHAYIGEEAIAVGVCSVLEHGDRITSTHRGHGHLIAMGADLARMMAELFGKRTGYCKGKGGSMHICDVSLGILGANGIVGGGIAIATGSALADRVLGRRSVTVAFFGDGAANQGVLMESLNLSAIWRLPIIFVCENNQYNEWTRSEESTAGRICDRASPFQIPGQRVDGNDLWAVRSATAAAVANARAGNGPSLIEAITYRHRGHEDGEEVFGAPKRPEDEVRRWKELDPLPRLREHLARQHGFTASDFETVEREEIATIADAVRFAEESPFPDPAEALEDVYAN